MRVADSWPRALECASAVLTTTTRRRTQGKQTHHNEPYWITSHRTLVYALHTHPKSLFPLFDYTRNRISNIDIYRQNTIIIRMGISTHLTMAMEMWQCVSPNWRQGRNNTFRAHKRPTGLMHGSKINALGIPRTIRFVSFWGV